MSRITPKVRNDDREKSITIELDSGPHVTGEIRRGWRSDQWRSPTINYSIIGSGLSLDQAEVFAQSIRDVVAHLRYEWDRIPESEKETP